MKFFAVTLVLLATVVCADVAVMGGHMMDAPRSNCFPDCTWNCDRPSCPAVCEPQCEKPNCELRCEKLPQVKCDIRCERPKCEVRCSRKNCQSGGCPLCENVCLPAKCQTLCTPPGPMCRPTCSAPKCTWSCRKPTTCPKPKCTLGCMAHPRPACGQKHQCCSCHHFENMKSAIELASSAHQEMHGQQLHQDLTPSFVEVAHEIRFKAANQAGEQCCPCHH